MRSKALKLSLIALLIPTMTLQTACWLVGDKGEKAIQQYSRANYDAAVAINEALKFVNTALNNRQLSPDKATAIATPLNRTNSVLREFASEVLSYTVVDTDGTERIEITYQGKVKLDALATSLLAVGGNIINDPAFDNIDSATRARLNAILVPLQLAIPIIFKIVSVIPIKKASAPALRVQLTSGVIKQNQEMLAMLDANQQIIASIGGN